jgi:hypothetical protein
MAYSRVERVWLTGLAIFGFVALNGAFAYGILFEPQAMTVALSNPIAAAFIVEALILVALLAYLFDRWGVSRLHWSWFVLLSLLGGLAFSIPVALLVSDRGRKATV